MAVLQWARQHGCPWNAMTCASAARGGHLAVLQWARRNGCDWCVATCRDAVSNGHRGVVQWVHENDRPCDGQTCIAGATAEVVQSERVTLLIWRKPTRCFRVGC